jgi:hypothetical protein
MNDLVRRRLETFQRVDSLGGEHAALFLSTSFAGEQFAVIKEVIQGLETHTSAQAGGLSASRQSTDSKAAARDELTRTLEAISRTARPMAATNPGVAEKFRVPRNQSDQALLAAARAIAAAALPLKAEFIKRGLSASFLDDLDTEIAALADANTQKIESRESHVSATAAIDDHVERGMNALRELDPIMRNTFADDPANLAAWMSASRVERTTSRSKATPNAKPKAEAPLAETETPKTSRD